MTKYILSIDQGTTSSRAIIFNELAKPIASAQQEFRQIFPEDGWVEHDANEIWISVLNVIKEALTKAHLQAQDIAVIGITNQRETTVVWDKKSGQPIYNAIVWQDRRSAQYCESLKQMGHEDQVKEKTGLLLDPYFSATKIAWILNHVEGARERAEKGELAFGTIDTWLLWNLTKGKTFATDATNASRTLLFNIKTQNWDEDLLALFNIPKAMLPHVYDCSADYGKTAADILGAEIAIGGVAGDQQAALIGQACFKPGMVKSTYGTGCFLVLNTGLECIQSTHRLLTTVAYRLEGKTYYALEGSIFMAGATIQWLRDGLKIIAHASDSQQIAEHTQDAHGVYLVPAFTGLGAPYWDPNARGAILGLTRDTGIGEIVLAGLQAVCFQTRDLMLAMQKDGAASAQILRVDGGMIANNWLAQRLADIMGVVVDRPKIIETTALGAAYLAGLYCGIFSSLEEIAALWEQEHRFSPIMTSDNREVLYQGWLEAVSRVTDSKIQ